MSPPQCKMIHGWCRLTQQYNSSHHWEVNSSEQPEPLAPGSAGSCHLSAKCQPQRSLRWEIKRKEEEMNAVRVAACQKYLSYCKFHKDCHKEPYTSENQGSDQDSLNTPILYSLHKYKDNGDHWTHNKIDFFFLERLGPFCVEFACSPCASVDFLSILPSTQLSGVCSPPHHPSISSQTVQHPFLVLYPLKSIFLQMQYPFSILLYSYICQCLKRPFTSFQAVA